MGVCSIGFRCTSNFDKLDFAIQDMEEGLTLDSISPEFYSYLNQPEVHLIVDTKPPTMTEWFEVGSSSVFRQINLFMVDLETEEIRPIKKLTFKETVS